MTEALSSVPLSIADWAPIARAAGFFLATFALEDAAALAAGLLLATGNTSWPAAFLPCFLGIWMGDTGLYAIARYAGRAWFERSPLRRVSAKVNESERWFTKRGTPILIFSRVVPGARLPTYLAAGFLRVPLPKFLLITGIASFLWTLAVLFLAERFGTRVNIWLGNSRETALILAGAGLVFFAGLQLLRRTSTRSHFCRVMDRLGRWRHWEFWPAWMFYPPVALYCLWLAGKYRGLTLPTAANPGIFTGGIVGESKIAILKQLHAATPELTAEAEIIAGNSVAERLRSFDEIRDRLNLTFPLILKPDIGQRGAGVKLIRTREQGYEYLNRTAGLLLVQRYAPGPHEAGIFYYRFPFESRGHIFAITEKIFPKVTGDGRHTVAQLIERDRRARFISRTYLKRFAARCNEVLATGEELKLVEAGNHAQGCIFRDGSRLHTPELERCIDQISQKLHGFFIGRYDIRFATEEDLRAGRNFQIIELNGAASEATSIYEARNSLLQAYRTLFRQWELVFAIGAANRNAGCAPAGALHLWEAWRHYSRLAATYPISD